MKKMFIPHQYNTPPLAARVTLCAKGVGLISRPSRRGYGAGFIALCLLFFITAGAYATAQFPDILIYKSKEYSLNTNPLEEYFRKYPDKRPMGGVRSTALWRGYIATFSIIKNNLCVIDIQIERPSEDMKEYETGFISVYKSVFPKDDKFHLDYYSGSLVIPYGKLVRYVHMGYGSVYENYIVLEIDKGVLKKELKLSASEYEQFREEQFEQFKKTGEYEKLFKKLNKESKMSEEYVDSFLRTFIIDYTARILADE